MPHPAPEKPSSVTRADVWDLGADPAAIRSAATLWTTLGAAIGSERSTFSAKVGSTMPHWKSDHGDSFSSGYSGPQQNGLTDAAGGCTTVASALTTLAGDLEDAQSRLDASLSRLTAAMSHSNIGLFGIDPVIVFHPDDDKDVALIDPEVKKAHGLVEDAQAAVSRCNSTLAHVPEKFGKIVTAWQPDADGTLSHWTNHPDENFTSYAVQNFGNTTVVDGTMGSEHVRMEIDPRTGDTVLVFSTIGTDDKGNTDPGDDTYTFTETKRITIPAGREVVLNTGAGNDMVEVPEGVNVKLRVLLGSGDDQVNSRGADNSIEAFGSTGRDRITTGGGNDFVSGGGESDYVDAGALSDRVFGGGGNDTIYGLDGNDLISGGDGRDYVDGGGHDDTVFGGQGADQLGGGLDNDEIYGGDGNDKVYAGSGYDESDGGVTWSKGGVTTDADEIDQESGDLQVGSQDDREVTVQINGDDGAFIEVQGSPEFQARVNSDLEVLRSSPEGQQLLKKLGELHAKDDGSWLWGQDKRPYIISEYPRDRVSDNGDAWDPDKNYRDDPPNDDAYCIRYRPEFNTLDNDADASYDVTPPVVVLYHEMGHTYQFLSDKMAEGRTLQDDGTSANSSERQNVGLPWNDNDRSDQEQGLAPDQTDDPEDMPYRENALRRGLGIPERTNY